MRRSLLVVVSFALLFVPSIFGQNIGPLPPLTARIDVKIINVDVSVTDRGGRPLAGLTKDDFEVFEDGKLQSIKNFDIIENAVLKGTAAPSTQAPASAFSDQSRRKFVLLVDNNYIDKIQRDMALAEIDKYVDQAFAGDHEWAIAAIGQRLEMLRPFTSDKREIHAAIDVIRKSAAFTESHALDRSILSDTLRRMELSETAKKQDAGLIPTIDYGTIVRFQAREQTYRVLQAIRNTANAVREMTHAYAASEGKKVLILITGGMETHTSFGAYERDQPDREVYETQRQIGIALDDVVLEANAANFALHIINAKSRRMMAPQHDSENARSGVDPSADISTKLSSPIDTTDVDSSSLTLALGTGGSYSTNYVAPSLAAVETLSSNYYSLGYTPPHEDDRRYHTIKVRVKKSGVNVAHRQGYIDLSAEDRLEQFLQARFSVDEKPGTLPIKIQIGGPVPSGEEMSVPVLTTLPMDRVTVIPVDGQFVGRVHVYVSVFDSEGKNIGFNHQMQEVSIPSAQYGQVNGASFRYTLNVHLKKGAFTIVMTVRDDLSNEIGSASKGVSI
jgi:VWFA-related protein